MSLDPCRECGKEVSTNAARCPHCGTPAPTREMLQSNRVVAVGGVLLGVAVFAAWLTVCTPVL